MSRYVQYSGSRLSPKWTCHANAEIQAAGCSGPVRPMAGAESPVSRGRAARQSELLSRRYCRATPFLRALNPRVPACSARACARSRSDHETFLTLFGFKLVYAFVFTIFVVFRFFLIHEKRADGFISRRVWNAYKLRVWNDIELLLISRFHLKRYKNFKMFKFNMQNK